MQQAPVEDALIEGFDDAQRRAWRLLSDVCGQVAVGMSEVDIQVLAQDRLREHGFDAWFHAPEVQVGGRIGGSPLLQRPSTRARLKPGELVSIDLGPAAGDFYGDVGTTLHLHEPGQAEPEVLSVARECARGCVGFASQWKTVGEVYVFAKAWAVNHNMRLASERSVGHALLPKEGWLSLGWPRSAHLATRMRRNQVHFLHPIRMRGFWAFRPLVSSAGLAASFEEAVFIDGERKRILGRDSLAEVGTLPAL